MKRLVLFLFALWAAVCAGAEAHPSTNMVCACEKDEDALPLSLFVQGDVRSGYVSRGKVSEDRPVSSLYARGSLDCGPVGSLGVMSWNLSSLGPRNTHLYRRAFHETDVALFWSYTHTFAEGWTLTTEAIRYWIMLPGYEQPYKSAKANAMMGEWRLYQCLSTPWVTPFYLLRRSTHPGDWLYARTGFYRKFDLGHGFTLMAQWYAESGNNRLFEQRYGKRIDGGEYGAGIQASNLIFEMAWRATRNLSFFTGVHQFNILSHDARDNVKANTALTARRDLTVAMVGCRLLF